MEKTCFKCGERKTLSEFYAHPQMPDGHVNKCKACNKKDNAENRQKKLDYYRQYDKDRFQTEHRRKKKLTYDTTWKANNPEKRAAHKAVQRAVASGKLVRQACERCGREDVHAHHEDYSKPLDVVWLCPICHKARHKELDDGRVLHRVRRG